MPPAYPLQLGMFTLNDITKRIATEYRRIQLVPVRSPKRQRDPMASMLRVSLRSSHLKRRHGNGLAFLQSSGMISNEQNRLTLVPHKRMMSTENPQAEPKLVYEAPMGKTVRIMKAVSVTSCFLTSVGMPALCVFQQQTASEIGKVQFSFFLYNSLYEHLLY